MHTLYQRQRVSRGLPLHGHLINHIKSSITSQRPGLCRHLACARHGACPSAMLGAILSAMPLGGCRCLKCNKKHAMCMRTIALICMRVCMHTALFDQGNRSLHTVYTLHGVSYLKGRESRPRHHGTLSENGTPTVHECNTRTRALQQHGVHGCNTRTRALQGHGV